jgi:hypothetical protein
VSVKIRTDRGMVRVVDKDCARRPCLQVHWSQIPDPAEFPEAGRRKGYRVQAFPLVCIRNETQGCPIPLPEPQS